MNLIKTATSSALIAALSLSVGCASKPDSQALPEEPSQKVAATSSDVNSAEPTSNEPESQVAPESSSTASSTEAPEQKAAKAEAAVSADIKQSEPSEKVVSTAESKAEAVKAAQVSAATPQVAKVDQIANTVPEKKEAVAAAQVKPAENVGKKPLKNALNISSKDLPVSLGIWTLRESFEAGEGLVLSTPTLQMGDGDYLSQIRLILKSDQLVIDSSSDIDTNLKGIGVRFNGGDIIPLDRVERGTVGIVEGDWMSRFAEGGKIEILLGFFPDKSKDSPVFVKEASIDDLSTLVPTYYKLQ